MIRHRIVKAATIAVLTLGSVLLLPAVEASAAPARTGVVVQDDAADDSTAVTPLDMIWG